MLFENGLIHVRPQDLECLDYYPNTRNMMLKAEKEVLWIQGYEMMWNLFDSLFPVNPLRRENVEYFLNGQNYLHADAPDVDANQVINDLLSDCEIPYLTIRCSEVGDTFNGGKITPHAPSLKVISVSSAIFASPDPTINDLSLHFEKLEGLDCIIALEPYRHRRGTSWMNALNITHPDIENPFTVKVIDSARDWKIADTMSVSVIEENGNKYKHTASCRPMMKIKKGQGDTSQLIVEITHRLTELYLRSEQYSTLPISEKYHHNTPLFRWKNRTKPFYARANRYWKDAENYWRDYHSES